MEQREFFWLRLGRSESVFEKSLLVAQATRLCRRATRRTEWQQPFEPMGTAFSYALRSSGRRVADRSGRVARATYF